MDAPPAKEMTPRLRMRLWMEMVLLFGGIPLAMLGLRERIVGWIFPIIWAATLPCVVYLIWHPDFDPRRLWRLHLPKTELWRILRIWAPLAILATVFMIAYEPERLFAFPRTNTGMWILVVVFYPILSAWPQEILYRAFFFHRYGALFRSEHMIWIASAALFGWAHVFLGTWIAVVFPALGGILFSRTYARTRSVAAATFEHGLWGDFLFTMGLGWYFFAKDLF